MSGALTVEDRVRSAVHGGGGDGDRGRGDAGGSGDRAGHSDVPSPRRSKRRWVAVAALVVVLLVAVVAGVGIPSLLHYQPIRAGMFLEGPVGAPVHQEHNATVFSYRDHALVYVGLTFENTSRFTATVEGFDDGPEWGVLKFKDVRAFDQWPKGCCLPRDASVTRFPLEVPPHSTRAVVLELRMTNCESYGKDTSVSWDRLMFPVTVLGVHHRVTVPLASGSQIFVDMPGPRTATCPRAEPAP